MVELPNGEAVVVIHIGTIKISSHITLTNVLCVPSFSFNLLYVSVITQSQMFFFFLFLFFLFSYCFI